MKKIWIILAVVVAAGLVIWLFLSPGVDDVTEEEPLLVDVTAVPDLAGSQKVFLHFTSRDGLHLSVLPATIDGALKETEKVRAVFELLCRGPGAGTDEELLFPVLPQETELLNVFLDGHGGVVLNVDRQFRERHPGGSIAELLSVYAVVNSLCKSFAWVDNVCFLMENEEVKDLRGHVNLCGKFLPNDDIIAQIEGGNGAEQVEEELDKDIIR